MSESTLTRRVLDQLGMGIVTGAIPGGAVLRIQDLENEFNVSRSVVRDALRSLKAMNLVTTKRSVGVTICQPADWDMFSKDVIRWRLSSPDWKRQLQSLAIVRSAIEPVAAGLAARTENHRETGAELIDIVSAMRSAGELGDLEGSLNADLRFHELILARCGDEMLSDLGEVVTQVLVARHNLHLRPRQPLSVPMALHQLVAVAIQEGDPNVAESASRALVAEVIEDLALHRAPSESKPTIGSAHLSNVLNDRRIGEQLTPMSSCS